MKLCMIVVLCEGNTLTKFDEGPMHGMHVTRPKAMHAGNNKRNLIFLPF